jgi:hypothetical protein
MPDTQDLGRSGGSPSANTQGEPGASDSRLSLDVNDPAFDFTKEWEDGKIYTLTSVRVTQISPGEFEVVSAEPGEEAEEGAPEEAKGAMGVAQDAGGGEGDTSPTGGTGYRNPVVAKLMAGSKS